MAPKRSFTVQAQVGERRRKATQTDLLEATKRLLEDGAPMAALSIDKIVTEAGVVRTTFYLHFRDKHELIAKLAEEQVDWIEAVGRSALADPELTFETIQRTIGELVNMWARNHAVLSAIIELAEYDVAMREKWGNAIRDVAGVANELFRAHWVKTGLAPEHPERVAEALSWMIERCSHQVAGDPAAREEIAGAMAEVIWRVLHPQQVHG